ncbi:hypothetical protein EAI77_07550 [Ligilactobacillus ruminis]|nr:hypothetical protein EAI77_07550 [Ligilactobacillus ruminis]
MPNKSRICSAFFNFDAWIAKCSAAHRLLDQRVSSRLRPKWRFLGFARKWPDLVTGKTAIFEICP